MNKENLIKIFGYGGPAMLFFLYIAAFMSTLSISITQIMYGIIAVYFIYGAVKGYYNGLSRNPYFIMILIIAAVFLLTSLAGNDPARSFRKYKLVILPLTFVIGYYMCAGENMRKIFACVLAGAAISSIYGFIRGAVKYYQSEYFTSMAGAFASPVSFGNIMALVIVLGAGVFLFKLYKTTSERNFYLITLVISVAGILGTTTRGALIACFAGLFILLVSKYRVKGIVISLMIIIAGTLIILLVPSLKFKFTEALTKWNDPTTSLGWRFVLWKESWRVFTEHPVLGVGLNNLHPYFQAFPVKYQSIAHAHNNVLHLLAEHGIVGFAAVCTLFVKLFYDQIRGVLQKNRYALVGAALFITFLVMGISEYSIFDSEICMLYFLLSGILLKAQQNDTIKESK